MTAGGGRWPALSWAGCAAPSRTTSRRTKPETRTWTSSRQDWNFPKGRSHWPMARCCWSNWRVRPWFASSLTGASRNWPMRRAHSMAPPSAPTAGSTCATTAASARCVRAAHCGPPPPRPHLRAPAYAGGGIDVFAFATGRVERLYDRCGGQPLKGPNDLVFDASGGFWFSDLGKRRARDMDRGFVYWARADGSEIREVIGPLLTPNGIGLSPDGKTLYVAETETARLWAWEITGPGQVRKRPWPSPAGGPLIAGVGGHTRFDSLALSANGNICVAALHAGAVIEIAPTGARVQSHPMPDLGVTNMCCGGADMRTAYVTLSHEGRLGAMQWHEPGLRLNFQQ